MSEALTALIGVIAGAVVTGGVQAHHAWTLRRVRGRTAARLLFLALDEVSSAVHTIQAGPYSPTWCDFVFDWRRPHATWVEQREAFVQLVATRDFRAVSAYFLMTDTLANCRDAQHRLPPAEREPPPLKLLTQLGQARDVVEPVLLKAATSWSERHRAKRR